MGLVWHKAFSCPQHQLKGYEEHGKEVMVVKLRKGLYGLKQAGCEWYATLQDFLINLGFRWTHSDHSVFIFEHGRSIVILPVYVDNKLLAGNDKHLLNAIQKVIGSRFKASNLVTISWILVSEIPLS